MKKLNFMLLAALAAVTCFSSCKDDDGATGYGITGVTVATADGTVRQGTVSQYYNTIEVTMPVTTQSSELEECTITATATMNTVVTIAGKPLEGNTFDLNSPVILTATNDGDSRTYTLTVSCTEEEADLATGKLISADITAGGIPTNTYAYSVALYDGKFYAFTAGATDTIASYKVYTSSNGKLWSEATTPEIVGGMGATSLVYNDKLYVVGGLRAIGYDKDGNAPEVEAFWGTMYSPTLTTLRIFSTNGSSWSNESIEGEQDPENMFKTMLSISMFGFVAPHLYEFNDKLYMQGGMMLSYGTFQGSNNLYVADGETFLPVQSAQSALKTNATTFVLNNKVFILGGTRGFIGPEVLLSMVSCSEDGENFTEVAETTAIGNICGATVVTNNAGDVAYLFGGLYYNDEGGREMNNVIYRSTNGVDWTAIEGINPAYAGTFQPQVVVDANDVAYVFGGFSSVIGSYTPYSLTQDEMDPSFAAWAFQIQ